MRAHRDGFTLLEVMVAVAFLVIAVLGTVMYFQTSSLLQQESKGYSLATAAANAALEHLMDVPFSEAYEATWEGDVVACCRDTSARTVLGNVFTQPVYNMRNIMEACTPSRD